MDTIFYFGNDYNAENRTSSHHIANILHKKNKKIVYVESPGLRKPSLGGRDLKKIVKKIFKTFRGPYKINDFFYVYTLFQIPFHKYRIIRIFNEFLIFLQLKLLQFRSRSGRVLYWFVIPHLSFLIRRLYNSNQTTIYYCIDNYSALPGVEKEVIKEMDKISTIYSSYVFVASSTLLKEKKNLNQKTFLSSHGVDYEHFSNVKQEIPKDIKIINKPIIGYWGLIEEWIDLNLLEQIAKELPDYSLVLLGYAAVDCGQLNNYRNVFFLGRKNYEELPKYGAFFDVSILPYKLTQQVINSNPMKLREYLSLGKPIVSVRFPEIEKFEDVVYISDSADEYILNIKRAVEQDSKEKRALRRSYVEKDSWDHKVDRILKLINFD